MVTEGECGLTEQRVDEFRRMFIKATPSDWLQRLAAAADEYESRLCQQAFPDPEPVKAKTFDEWIQSTSELLDDCAKRKK